MPRSTSTCSNNSLTGQLSWTCSAALACSRFIYFTSNKSAILELCDWLGRHKSLGNPFRDCQRREFNATLNHTASYTDMMLFTTH